MEQLKKSLNGLKKLSVKSNHAYEEVDVEEITSFLTTEIYEVIHRFSTTADNRLKYYLQVEKDHYRFLQLNDPELFNLIKDHANNIEIFLKQDNKDQDIKDLETQLKEIKQVILQNSESIGQIKDLLSVQNLNEYKR